jgi:hypothetical protein
MIVRIEVQDHSMVQGAWELTRCQVQLEEALVDVIYPAYWRFFRFATLQEAIRHAKKTTFRYLERTKYRGLPEQFDWQIYDLGRPFLCSGCGQPQYCKATLGHVATTLDLRDWACPACRECVRVG